MDNIWLVILIFGGWVCVVSGISYMLNLWANENFLCKVYKDATTKVGFIIFLMLDIAMLPWTLVYCLISGIVLLFKKIMFRKKD